MVVDEVMGYGSLEGMCVVIIAVIVCIGGGADENG